MTLPTAGQIAALKQTESGSVSAAALNAEEKKIATALKRAPAGATKIGYRTAIPAKGSETNATLAAMQDNLKTAGYTVKVTSRIGNFVELEISWKDAEPEPAKKEVGKAEAR